MSVYDIFEHIEMVVSIVFVVFCVCLIITALASDSIPLVITSGVGVLVSALIMIANPLYVREVQYSNTEYNVSQMAIDYDARVIESDNADCPYISRFEGYGDEEWIYFVRKSDAQDMYRRETDC